MPSGLHQPFSRAFEGPLPETDEGVLAYIRAEVRSQPDPRAWWGTMWVSEFLTGRRWRVYLSESGEHDSIERVAEWPVE
jgi:hypothetical protein